MDKPPKELFDLISLGRIHGIYIASKQTGTDTCDTECIITGDERKIFQGWWSSYTKFLIVNPDWDTIAHVKPEYIKQMEDWKKFHKGNLRELSEYERLKKKFGDKV